MSLRIIDANLPWLSSSREELGTTELTPRDQFSLGALVVATLAYIAALFFWLGWWALPVSAAYLVTIMVVALVVAPSRQSSLVKALTAVLIPTACVTLLTAILVALV